MGALYLIRHARAAVEGVLLGQSNPPLSQRGREEAVSLLGGIAVERVYSSPLRRALETAAVLQSTTEVTVLDELAEISLGAWDGRPWEEVERADPHLARRKTEDWFGVTPPGGEPWDAFSTRVLAALEVVRAGAAPAAIVAHLAVNSVIAAKFVGGSPREFQQAYCEVIEIDV
jgi:broad specificity phosphatase PhoE